MHESIHTLNEPLATAYYMKEDLRQMWKQADKPSAKTFLEDWISRAQTSGIRMLKDVAKTLEFFKRSLLAWYRLSIFHRPTGGNQQQDQDTAKTSLWIP